MSIGLLLLSNQNTNNINLDGFSPVNWGKDRQSCHEALYFDTILYKV